MRFLALFIAAFGLLSSPCEAALSAVSINTHTSAGATTNVLTTSGSDCPIGSLPVVATVYLTIADTLSSVADNVSNTWQAPFDNITGTLVGVGSAYAINTTADISVGKTITATFAGSTPSGIAGICITGAATTSPLDVSNKTQQGTAATAATSVSTGTLAQANEIVVGVLVGTVAIGVVTCGTGWTKLPTLSNANGSVTICVQIVAATTSVSFAPTWANTANYVTDVYSFKAAGGATITPTRTLLGAGP
jgi:hypothetical protein